ncbi:MAG: hypothetical protein JRE82_15430 [Deltaproteobacteria bacterium]|nr:hypothetical protein [Deltaproteobacteria bacterium]
MVARLRGGRGNRDARCEEETEGHRLSGAGLGRNAEVAACQFRVQDRLLNGGEILESGFAQGGTEARGGLL